MLNNRSKVLDNTLKRNPYFAKSKKFQNEARKLLLAFMTNVDISLEDVELVYLCQEISMKKNRYIILDTDLSYKSVNKYSALITENNHSERLQSLYDAQSKSNQSFPLLKIKIFSVRNYGSHFRIQIFCDIEQTN